MTTLVCIGSAEATSPTEIALSEKSVLTITDDGSSAGYVTISWAGKSDAELKTPASTEYQLQIKQQSQSDDDYKTIYQGRDNATTLSGLENGNYQLRLQSAEGVWSEPLQISISHHALNKALAFFAIGLVLFLSLLILIFSPSHKSESE